MAILLVLNFPRSVLLFNRMPLGISFIRRSVRIGINPVLEFIDRNSIRKEFNRISKVGITILIRLIEEEVHIRFSEEFHGHRIDFATFHGRRTIFRNLDVTSHISLERMSKLMG